MLSPHPLPIHPKLNKKFRENSAISATQGNGATAPSRFRANQKSLYFPLPIKTNFSIKRRLESTLVDTWIADEGIVFDLLATDIFNSRIGTDFTDFLH
ncbi:MAG: hypothetical protein K2M88_01380 [Muribaculaceae bacterium]|nr:hypothetical protein [Muribaculaceae bacterium]